MLEDGPTHFTVSLCSCRPSLSFESEIFWQRKLVGGCDPLRIKVGAVLIGRSMLACRNHEGAGQNKPGGTKSQVVQMVISIQRLRRSNRFPRCEPGGDLPRAADLESTDWTTFH